MPEWIFRPEQGGPFPDCSLLLDLETDDNTWNQAKAHGHPVYLDASGLILEDELEPIETILKKRQDADGIYYGDEAVWMILEQLDYKGKRICNPETLVCCAQDATALQAMGADIVSLAHELSLDEVCTIAKDAKNLEVLVHGHVPILYSGRQLITNYNDSRDGLYHLRELTRQDELPVLQKRGRTTLYSANPIQSLDQIQKLANAGINRFRIDSRFLQEDGKTLLDAYQQALQGNKTSLTGSDAIWKKNSVKTKGEAND